VLWRGVCARVCIVGDATPAALERWRQHLRHLPSQLSGWCAAGHGNTAVVGGHACTRQPASAEAAAPPYHYHAVPAAARRPPNTAHTRPHTRTHKQAACARAMR
jgi:hypothetical protein